MIIAFTLTIMIIITLFSIIIGSDFVSVIIEGVIDSEVLINGSITEFGIEGFDTDFSIDPITGAIAIIITIVAFASVIGIQILGSGLSDPSIRTLIMATAYIGLWSVLTALAIPLIYEIEIFGSLMYITLTIGYTIGVINKGLAQSGGT